MSDKQKYEVKMTEVYRMRMTAEQKRRVMEASLAGTASDFWRDYSVYTAEQIVRLQAGELTPAEFGANMADYVTSYLSATLPGQEPEPDE